MTLIELLDVAFAVLALAGMPVGRWLAIRSDERLREVVKDYVIAEQIDYVLVIQGLFVSCLTIIASIVLTVDDMGERTMGVILIITAIIAFVRVSQVSVAAFAAWPLWPRYLVKCIPIASVGIRIWTTHYV